jgi:hypothetical protein
LIILESNQNHARAEDTEVCPTLPAAMGMGGGYVPMIVQEQPTVIANGSTIKIDRVWVAFTLMSRDYKDPQIVVTEAKTNERPRDE